jgi:hypothetical protein
VAIWPRTSCSAVRLIPGGPGHRASAGLLFLAVTDQEVALVKLRARKVVMLKAADMIARIPRSQLLAAELSPGYVAPLELVFTSGDSWRLEVPPPSKRYARAVVHALGGRIASRKSMPPGPKPRMTGYRIACGIIWAVIAVGIGAGGVAELTVGMIGGAVVCFVIAIPAAWYDYRIWALKARRLLLMP